MNPSDKSWSRLTSAARAAGDPRDAAAPYGFSTRVVAMAWARERSTSLLERFSWRALAVAALLAVVSTAANYSLFAPATADDEVLANDGDVAALLDFSS